MIGDEIPSGTLAEKQKRIEELEAELATPIMVQTNRLVDALADARAGITKLKAKLRAVLEKTDAACLEMIAKFDRTFGTP